MDIIDESSQGLSGFGTPRGEGGGVTLPSLGAALDRNGGKAGQSAAGSA